MFCPKCGCEYRDGYTICTDCGENLIQEKPTIKSTSIFANFISHAKAENSDNDALEIINAKDRKIKKNCTGVYALAAAHLIIALYYIFQLLRILRCSIFFDDDNPISRDAVVNGISYVIIAISLFLSTLNFVSCIGLVKGKAWAWWFSGSYFISLIPQNIILIIFNIKLGFETQESLNDSRYFRFIFVY